MLSEFRPQSLISLLKKNRWPLGIIAAAFLIRVLHLIAIRDFYFFGHFLGDVYFFDKFARLVARGLAHTETLNVALSPVYVGFLAACYKLFGYHPLVPRLIQIFLGSLGCVLLYRIGKQLWNRNTGIFAGAISAFHGIFIFYDPELRKPGLANFFIILSLFFLCRIWKKPKFYLWAAAGAAFAAASLLRMNLFLFLPVIFAWAFLALLRKKDLPGLLISLFIFGISFGGTVAAGKAWLRTAIPRQTAAFQESGMHFYIGNNPDATGTYQKPRGIDASATGHTEQARKIAEKISKRKLTDDEVNRFWFLQGRRFIRERPKEWLALELRKFFLLANAYEIPNDENYDAARRNSRVLSLPLFSYGLIGALGVLGIWLNREKWTAGTALLLFFLVSYAVTLLATFVTSGYRLPVHIPLILFSASAIDRTKALWDARQFKTLAAGAMIFLAFFVLMNAKSFLPKERYDKFLEKRIEKAKSRVSSNSLTRHFLRNGGQSRI